MQEYWKRIGLTGREDLDIVQSQHLQSIPFENLSVLAGHGVQLDRESIWNKLVLGGRGGYCFEQNSLFETVLLEQGYSLVSLAARVRRGVKELRPHTHKLLRLARRRFLSRRWLWGRRSSPSHPVERRRLGNPDRRHPSVDPRGRTLGIASAIGRCRLDGPVCNRRSSILPH